MDRRTFFRSAAAAAALTAAPRIAAAHAPRRSAFRWPGEIEAITGDGRSVTLSEAVLAELKASLHGPMLLAGDEGYEEARLILSPSFDRRPAVIVQPTGPADVRTAVDFARDHGGLLLAVKCGGHSFSGQSTVDRGMMIDLSRFRDVRVDARARSARVTGGTLLRQVDHETAAVGLVTPLGTVSHTGVGGLVTGGGFGRLARRYGLAIDNLLSVDVVTADGTLRHASDQENQDLFWGVRGGGGNFGVVTSFEFRLHPMQREVIGGNLVFPFERVRDVLAMMGDYAFRAPDELSLGFTMVQPPGAEPGIVIVEVCYAGGESEAERALAPVRALGRPIADTVRRIEYVRLQRSGDSTDPRAQGLYLKSGFIGDLRPALASAIVDHFHADPRRATLAFFQMSGGAIARVPPSATAFSQRDVFANLLVASAWPWGADPTDHIQAIRDYWKTLEPFTHGFYVNDLELETTAEAVRANYRENHRRLVAVKNRYDPTNLFRLNANVKPTV